MNIICIELMRENLPKLTVAEKYAIIIKTI